MLSNSAAERVAAAAAAELEDDTLEAVDDQGNVKGHGAAYQEVPASMLLPLMTAGQSDAPVATPVGLGHLAEANWSEKVPSARALKHLQGWSRCRRSPGFAAYPAHQTSECLRMDT